MPLALLLQSTFVPLTDRDKGVPRIAAWADVGERLALVGQRMRTAYLVRWFGPDVPTRGNALRVSFTNLKEVLAKATNVRSLQKPTPVDAGMAGETAMGMVGGLAGWAFSPFVSISAGIAILTTSAPVWAKIVLGLNALTLGAVPLALGTLAPLIAGVGGDIPVLDKVKDTAGGLAAAYEGIAEVAGPLATIWEQLTGPRDKVRNPVLRAMLLALDDLARLVPQLFGAGAYLLTWVLPAVNPALDAMAAMGRFVKALVDGLIDAGMSLVEALMKLFKPDSGPGIVGRTLELVMSSLGALANALSAAFDGGIAAFVQIGDIAKGAFVTGWDNIKAVAKAHVTEHPLMKIGPAFTILKSQMGVWISAFVNVMLMWIGQAADQAMGTGTFFQGLIGRTTIPPPGPSGPDYIPDLTLPSIDWRPFDAIVTGAGVGPAPPDPFALSSKADAALKARPRSVFAGELAETARRWKDSAKIRAAALELLPALQALVPQLTPPRVAEIAKLLGGPAHPPEPEAPSTPVRALEPVRLRPRISELRVEVPASFGKERADEWVTSLRALLDSEVILAPAGAR